VDAPVGGLRERPRGISSERRRPWRAAGGGNRSLRVITREEGSGIPDTLVPGAGGA